MYQNGVPKKARNWMIRFFLKVNLLIIAIIFVFEGIIASNLLIVTIGFLILPIGIILVRKDIRTEIRSTFKLPPIYTGDTTDYTRATALESARVAEEQVFEPERREFDQIFNRTVLADMQINYWKFTSIGVKTADLVQIVKSMGMVKDGITLGVIQEAVADMRKVPHGSIPPEHYNITLAEHLAALQPKPEEKDEDEEDVDDDDSSSDSDSSDSDDDSKPDS